MYSKKQQVKKALIITILIGIAALMIICFGLILHSPKYILNNLDISQIESITLYSLSPNEAAVLSENDVSELYELLKQVKITGKSNDDFRYYDGGRWVQFHIKIYNKKGFDFAGSTPFYIINGQNGYEADDEISSHMSSIYYSLVVKYFPQFQR
ncbi:MAG: hypothetical protein FWG91_10655 [Lachnospiraceae bacterium]|nr:hypothetical protein [Lachnospiraceae bacterium]